MPRRFKLKSADMNRQEKL